MIELIMGLKPMFEAVSQVVFALVILATAIARLTPSPDDDVAVGKVRAFLLNVVRFLPTVGVNPQTKKLEKALKK